MYVHIKDEDLGGWFQAVASGVGLLECKYLTIPCLVVSVFANFYQMSRASKNGLFRKARRLICLSSTNSVRVMVEIADYLRMTLLYVIIGY